MTKVAKVGNLGEKMVLMYVHERAKCQQLISRYEEAIQDFSSVIKKQPKNAHALFRRAFCYKALKMYDKAADDFEAARLIKPDNPNFIVNYRQIHTTECIVLRPPGHEDYENGNDDELPSLV